MDGQDGRLAAIRTRARAALAHMLPGASPARLAEAERLVYNAAVARVNRGRRPTMEDVDTEVSAALANARAALARPVALPPIREGPGATRADEPGVALPGPIEDDASRSEARPAGPRERGEQAAVRRPSHLGRVRVALAAQLAAEDAPAGQAGEAAGTDSLEALIRPGAPAEADPLSDAAAVLAGALARAGAPAAAAVQAAAALAAAHWGAVGQLARGLGGIEPHVWRAHFEERVASSAAALDPAAAGAQRFGASPAAAALVAACRAWEASPAPRPSCPSPLGSARMPAAAWTVGGVGAQGGGAQGGGAQGDMLPGPAACRELDAAAARFALVDEDAAFPEANAPIARVLAARAAARIVERESTLYRCPRCKKSRCSYHEEQRRAADEPATIVCLCLECGNKFCQN